MFLMQMSIAYRRKINVFATVASIFCADTLSPSQNLSRAQRDLRHTQKDGGGPLDGGPRASASRERANGRVPRRIEVSHLDSREDTMLLF